MSRVQAHLLDSPVGPLRDKKLVNIGTDDYVDKQGFICQIAASAGTKTLDYRTLGGSEDQSEAGLDPGAVISVGTTPVLLRAIRGTSTVTQVVVGTL